MIQYIIENDKNKITTQHLVINVGKAVLMNKEPKLVSIINRASIINAYGQSIVWRLKLLGKVLPERVTVIDLMEEFIIL